MKNYIRMEHYIYSDNDEITQEQMDSFLDKFVELVEANDYWCCGSTYITNDNKLEEESKRDELIDELLKKHQKLMDRLYESGD